MPYPTKKLGEIVDILDNQRKPISSNERGKRNLGKTILYPYYGATQQNGVIDDYLFDEELVLLGEDGVDFYSKDKHKAYLISGKTWVNNHAHVLKGKKGILLNKFLLNFLNIFDYHGYVSGATRLKLSQSSMKSIPIPLPPLKTQQLIVKKLDEAFANVDTQIELLKSNISGIEELNKSVLEEVFSERDYEVKKLGELYDITSSKRVFQSEWKKEGIPFYRAREIVKLAQNGYVENDLFISHEMYEKYSEKYGSPKEHDIMITGVGTLGICYVVKKNDKFYFKDGNIIWLKDIGKEVDSRFIEYSFKSEFVKKQIQNNTGAVVGTYTIIRAKNTKIPLTPLEKQKEIVAYLDQVFEKNKALKEKYQSQIQTLQEMKQSLLQDAFEGKLIKE